MLVNDSQGREVEIQVGGRYEDDIQIEEATYVNSDIEVSEEEIDYIYETYPDSLYEAWLEMGIRRAEDYCDMER